MFVDIIFLVFVFVMFLFVIVVCFMRIELIDVFVFDYVLFVKVKGNSRMEVVVKYVICNVFIFLIIVLGLLLVVLMIGFLVIENIYSIFGIGS